MIIDYEKIANSSALQAELTFNYYDHEQNLKEDEIVKGFLTSGFGFNLTNEFNDLLSTTENEDFVSKTMQSIQLAKNMLTRGGSGWMNEQAIVKSVLQTIQMWKTMNNPSFDIDLLFFDAVGSGWIQGVAEKLLLSQMPKVSYLGENQDSGTFNLLQYAPAGYNIERRDNKNSKNPNKTFGLNARGTCSLRIGHYAFLDDLILTGVNINFSDKLIKLEGSEDSDYRTTPMFLKAHLSFKFWRQIDNSHIHNMFPMASRLKGSK